MTQKAPERIWAVDGLTEILSFNVYDNGGTEYLRADHALAPVAAAYEDAAKFALDTADQEQGDDGVTWGDMAQIEDAIHSRTPADAQAALERVKREARNEALREAQNIVRDSTRPDMAIELLHNRIQKNQSDE